MRILNFFSNFFSIFFLTLLFSFFLIKSTNANQTPKIFINEILPNPAGKDAKNEWIELYNPNNFKVNLFNWQIRDKKGKTSTYTFPENTIIPAEDYLVLKEEKTKIILNNNGDGLELANPQGKIIDYVYFDKTFSGKSYNRKNNNWQWSSKPTPGKKNIITLTKNKSLKFNPNQNQFSQETAFVGIRIAKPPQSSVILSAIITALLSAITILIIKIKTK